MESYSDNESAMNLCVPQTKSILSVPSDVFIDDRLNHYVSVCLSFIIRSNYLFKSKNGKMHSKLLKFEP